MLAAWQPKVENAQFKRKLLQRLLFVSVGNNLQIQYKIFTGT